MRRLLGLWICIAFVNISFGQGKVSGTVLDPDGTPVYAASIYLPLLERGTSTDEQGYFFLSGLPLDSLRIRISGMGYTTVYIDTLLERRELSLVIQLEDGIIELPQFIVDGVSITGGLSGADYDLGSAHYIGQKEIQRFSYTDINRTLRNIPGLNIQEEDGYGLRPNIGLRATGSERSSKITVMEDGVLAAPAPYAAPSAYYFPTIGRMEAIEILKGSSQIKYGPYTTGGAINLISTPIPLDLSTHADYIVGSNDYRMLHANLGNSHKNVAYLVETMQYSTKGFKQLDSADDTGFDKEDFLAKIRLNTDPGVERYQSLMFKIAQSTERSNETYLGLTQEDFELNPIYRYAASQKDQINFKHQQMALTHIINASSFLDIRTTIYRNTFARNWYKLDKVNGKNIGSVLMNPEDNEATLSLIKGQIDGIGGLKMKANNRSYISRGAQSNFIFHFGNREVNHKVDIGIRWHYDEVDRYQWVDDYTMNEGIMQLYKAGVQGTESNRISSAQALATFVQYKLEFGSWLITPGLRYENIRMERLNYGNEDPQRLGTELSLRNNTISVLIPGLAMRYQWSDALKVFGGAHKGFAPPGSKPGAKAEQSWNYELGIGWEEQRWNAQVLGYMNQYNNLLGTDLSASGGLGTGELFNGGRARASGIEFEGSYDLLSDNTMRLPVSIAYTLSDAIFKETFESQFAGWGDVASGDQVPYISKHQISVSLSLEHPKWLVDIGARYGSEMLARAGRFSDDTPRTDEAFTVDVGINYRMTPQISAFANVNNVLDNVYVVALRPAGLRPNLPRTINLGLKANL